MFGTGQISTDLLSRIIGQDPTGRDYVQRVGVTLEPVPGSTIPIPYRPASDAAGLLLAPVQDPSLPPASGLDSHPPPSTYTEQIQNYTNSLPEPGYDANTFGIEDAPVQYDRPESADVGGQIAERWDEVKDTLAGVHDIEGPRSMDDAMDMLYGRERDLPPDWSRNDPPADSVAEGIENVRTGGLDYGMESPFAQIPGGPTLSFDAQGNPVTEQMRESAGNPILPSGDGGNRATGPGVSPTNGAVAVNPETAAAVGADPETGLRTDQARAMSLMDRILGPQDSDRRASTGQALMAAGATIMSTGGSLGQSIGAGIRQGLVTYDEAMSALKEEEMAMRELQMEEEAHAIEMAAAELALERARAQPIGGSDGDGDGTSSMEGDLGDLFMSDTGRDMYALMQDLQTMEALAGDDPAARAALDAVYGDEGTYARSAQQPDEPDWTDQFALPSE